MVAQPISFDDNEIRLNWQEILESIPYNANEPLVCKLFVEPLLAELGFSQQEWFPEFSTGKGSCKVDYAARKNNHKAIFIKAKTNPYLLIEAKGRQTNGGAKINLATGTPQYKDAQIQIKDYLLSPNCKTAQWGIITNSEHIQLFRRHGKVVFPATENYLIKKDNIEQIITQIKRFINQTPRALSICVYNDKGGVGKSTTVANLASVLGILNKKVLVIDFDPQQGDLTASLGKGEASVKFSDALMNTKINIDDVIQPFFIQLKQKQVHVFDLICPDDKLEEIMTNEIKMAQIQGGNTRLRRLIHPLLNCYDYIIFDSPTNWSFLSKSCVYASDVVLIPTNSNNFASLKNAKKVIKQYLPEIQDERRKNHEYGIPIALPIFFNQHSSTEAQMKTTHEEIKKLLTIETPRGSLRDEELFSLFYPKSINGLADQSVFNIPQYAIVASAAFSRRPAALSHQTAYQYYLALAKEYFINE